MGREFASAAARWVHLDDLGVRPELVAVCDTNPRRARAGTSGSTRRRASSPTTRELLADDSVEAVYCAVPHHLHEEVYVAVLRAGKHLLGEKPFGIDLPRTRRSTARSPRSPDLLVRCSSELPFYPGGQEVVALDRRAPLRARDRGALALPALQRPRPAQADQLEAAARR